MLSTHLKEKPVPPLKPEVLKVFQEVTNYFLQDCAVDVLLEEMRDPSVQYLDT